MDRQMETEEGDRKILRKENNNKLKKQKNHNFKIFFIIRLPFLTSFYKGLQD